MITRPSVETMFVEEGEVELENATQAGHLMALRLWIACTLFINQNIV